MKKRLWAIFLAAVMLLTAAGCGAEPAEEEPEPDPAPVEEPVEPAEPEPYVPAGTNPLTGMPMEPVYEQNRPVAVMLNNLKAAQPQLGVSQADIIYEVPAEGGITRMLGVFQTLEGVGDLGSIRSARPYYLELALGHDALFVHAGGSPEAYRDISAWDVDNMDGVNGGSDAKIFWRDAYRRKHAGYEHSLLTSGENILAYLDQDHFRTEHEAGYETSQLFTEDGTPCDAALFPVQDRPVRLRPGERPVSGQPVRVGLHRRQHRGTGGGHQFAGAGDVHLCDLRRHGGAALGEADRQRRGHLLLRRQGRAHYLEQGGSEQSSGLSPDRRHAAGAGKGNELCVHHVPPHQHAELYRMTCARGTPNRRAAFLHPSAPGA